MRRASLLLAVLATFPGGFARADGRCDLNTVVGYQIVFAKPIERYIQGGQRQKGYEGCEPDRVLVFADNTGVKCKNVVRHHLEQLPTAYLFARSQSDMRLCVGGLLLDVSQTN